MRGGMAGTAVLAAAVIAAAAAVPALASGSHPLPDLKQLYGPVTRHVRAADRGQLRRAVLYEADGFTTRGRETSSAAGITHWHFVFDNPTPKSRYQYATVDYGPAPRTYSRVSVHKMPWLEDYQLPHAPKLSLVKAVALLHRAGDPEKFDGVTLRYPVAPPFKGALYIFALVNSHHGHTYVSVNATTGRVRST